MRRIFLLIFVLLPGFAWTQSLRSKKVTIELTNITLEEALTILSISYGVEFSYSDDVVPTQETVDLSIQHEDLASALNKLLGKFNLGYKVSNNRVLLKRLPVIITQTIRGSVRDEITNDPIPGATILVSNNGTQLGNSTDSLGRFKIKNVPVGRISIVISCIGFYTRTVGELLLGTGKELVLDLNISESVTAMNEVVVKAQKYEAIPGDGVALTSSKSFSVEETQRYAGSMGDPARMASAFVVL